MGPVDLIDTTEIYLKTIYEMEEDGVVPMRARIVERLGHSGPTVSQTVARMERDGLVTVRDDRRLELTEQGFLLASEVMRKHRLAECLLISVIGMDWSAAHEEACRWEHVMSYDVEQRLNTLLDNPDKDPYGNPIPSAKLDEGTRSVRSANVGEISAEQALAHGSKSSGRITRIGEPIQADRVLLALMAEAGIGAGTPVELRQDGERLELRVIDADESGSGEGAGVVLSVHLAPHLFIESL
ncbi:metal-dependent transcriptional regulator [Actinomycetaceae bacterium MB13-C1-2]|nr:metal-dependent transcriptional regulator [Actinomycetaceae bacterium MB13-C1-2]